MKSRWRVLLLTLVACFSIYFGLVDLLHRIIPLGQGMAAVISAAAPWSVAVIIVAGRFGRGRLTVTDHYTVLGAAHILLYVAAGELAHSIVGSNATLRLSIIFALLCLPLIAFDLVVRRALFTRDEIEAVEAGTTHIAAEA